MPTIFEGYPPLSWSVRGQKYFFPALSISETGANRIVERERPFRDGAKLDDTGSKAVRWVVEAIFENTVEETGLDNGEMALYPDVLNALVDSFKQHETGDLVLPTVGKRRARAEGYSRREQPEEQDAATVTFTFVEDNEDAVRADSFRQPTANANARRLSEVTTFDQESLDNGHFSISDLQESVSELEGLMNAPLDYAQDIESSSKRVGQLAVQVVQVFSNTGQRGRDTLLGSRGNRASRKMVREQDMAARAANESRRGRPVIVRFVALRDTSLFSVAAYLRQPYVDLLAVNPQLEDPSYIPRGSEVRVFAATGELR